MIRLLHEKKDPDKTTMEDIMTREVKVAREDDDIVDWLRIMSNERFRHLPVVNDNNQLVNMMSQGDFVSYTWPSLLTTMGAKAKESLSLGYQIPMIILALAAYAWVISFFG
jgi:CBS-domain-containing membrane protein